MNLLDLRSKQWSAPVVGAMPPPANADLPAKLGPAAPSHAVVGPIAPYYTSVYGFPSSASVIAWSGDNPCSVAGLGLRSPGDVAVSLGTSDTMFGILATPLPGTEGHIFANPVDPASYMAMLCYKNGSLCREGVRNAVAGGSWDSFNALLAKSAPGNGGRIGFFFESPEITPTVLKAGTRRFEKKGGSYARVGAFSDPTADARAVVEGQFLSMRLHGESIGMKAPTRLIATGGASSNAAVLQVLADVFGAPVFVAQQTDSASLGAAYRAAHGWAVSQKGGFVPFETVLQHGAGAAAAGKTDAASASAGPVKLSLAASPRPSATSVYSAMLPEYAACEAQVTSEN
jgi:xylulokinase